MKSKKFNQLKTSDKDELLKTVAISMGLIQED